MDRTLFMEVVTSIDSVDEEGAETIYDILDAYDAIRKPEDRVLWVRVDDPTGRAITDEQMGAIRDGIKDEDLPFRCVITGSDIQAMDIDKLEQAIEEVKSEA